VQFSAVFKQVRDRFYAKQHGSEWSLALWFVQWIFKSLFGRISVKEAPG
jgi:hypothetical protein